MHYANCAALTTVLFTTLIENLKLCSCAEAGIVLKFWPRVLIKLFLYSNSRIECWSQWRLWCF